MVLLSLKQMIYNFVQLGWNLMNPTLNTCTNKINWEREKFRTRIWKHSGHQSQCVYQIPTLNQTLSPLYRERIRRIRISIDKTLGIVLNLSLYITKEKSHLWQVIIFLFQYCYRINPPTGQDLEHRAILLDVVLEWSKNCMLVSSYCSSSIEFVTVDPIEDLFIYLVNSPFFLYLQCTCY